MFKFQTINWFELEGAEYWDSMPHSRGTTQPSSYLKIVNGSLYQWWPIPLSPFGQTGIWIKVPNVTTYEKSKTQQEENCQEENCQEENCQEDYHGEGS